MQQKTIQQQCWRKLTYAMLFLSLFVIASYSCMILEEKNPRNTLWGGTIEYTVSLNFVFMGLALSFACWVDLWKLVQKDLSIAQDENKTVKTDEKLPKETMA